MHVLTLKDFEEGRVFESIRLKVSEAEMVKFAKQFDPQSFHLPTTNHHVTPLYDRIFASGWHSAALCQKLMVESFLGDSTCLGSPGIDYMHWLAPLFGGDEIRTWSQVQEMRPSQSKPDRGLVKIKTFLLNQEDKPLVEMMLKFFAATEGR